MNLSSLVQQSKYVVTITTSTSNGANTKGTISIKFRGTNGESTLFTFKKGLDKGEVTTMNYELTSIGTLTQVYLELDELADTWRFATVSITVDGSDLFYFDKSAVLYTDIPNIWLNCNFLFFFLSLFFFF